MNRCSLSFKNLCAMCPEALNMRIGAPLFSLLCVPLFGLAVCKALHSRSSRESKELGDR